MSNSAPRINVPTQVNDFVFLVKTLLAKHEELGDQSPFRNLDMADLKGKLAIVEAKDKEADMHQKAGKTAIEERNRAIGSDIGQNSTTEGTALYYVKSCRDILLGHNKGKEQKLSEFGFSVINASKANGKPDLPGNAAAAGTQA